MARTDRRATLVDSNVLLDVITGDAEWAGWSISALSAAATYGAIVVNPIVFAEVSVRFTTIEGLVSALPEAIERANLPWPAAFLAGKVHGSYRPESTSRRLRCLRPRSASQW